MNISFQNVLFETNLINIYICMFVKSFEGKFKHISQMHLNILKKTSIYLVNRKLYYFYLCSRRNLIINIKFCKNKINRIKINLDIYKELVFHI